MTITFLTGVRTQPTWSVRHATRWEPLSVTVDRGPSQLSVSALGEVDAGNAKSFADQVCAAIVGAGDSVRVLTVDLSGLEFFAVDGCTALHAVNALAMRRSLSWSVLPSAAVSRVLQLCDPASLIPAVELEALAEPA